MVFFVLVWQWWCAFVQSRQFAFNTRIASVCGAICAARSFKHVQLHLLYRFS